LDLFLTAIQPAKHIAYQERENVPSPQRTDERE